MANEISKKEIVQAYEGSFGLMDAYIHKIATEISTSADAVIINQVASISSKLAQVETALKGEREVISQIAGNERKTIEQNAKIEKDKIVQLISEAKGESDRIQENAKKLVDSVNKQLEAFRINHISVLEKKVLVLENNMYAAAALLGKKE